VSTSSTTADPRRRPPPGAILLIPVAVALMLTLFAWPAARQEPRDLPIGVAGPAAAANLIEQRLSAREGAFDLNRYSDEAAARRAIEDRDVYGAFVATPAGMKVLTASAASQTVAQLLERAAGEGRAHTQDVVPATPASTALGSSVLPLVLAGLLAGAAAARLTSGGLGRVGLVLAGSILAGLVANAIVQSWLDVVEGAWPANAAVLSLTVLAIASVVAGLYALLGPAGAIVGASTMVLVGNPFSGVGTAPELLPEPVGAIGQLMPPGAGGNLLRSTGFFDGAGSGGHVAVLAVWALGGLAMLLGGWAKDRRPVATDASAPAA
jgi:hypothetical protein